MNVLHIILRITFVSLQMSSAEKENTNAEFIDKEIAEQEMHI